MGYNGSGELGLGDTTARVSPTHIRSLLTPIRSISMSTNSCGEVAAAAIDLYVIQFRYSLLWDTRSFLSRKSWFRILLIY